MIVRASIKGLFLLDKGLFLKCMKVQINVQIFWTPLDK